MSSVFCHYVMEKTELRASIYHDDDDDDDGLLVAKEQPVLYREPAHIIDSTVRERA